MNEFRTLKMGTLGYVYGNSILINAKETCLKDVGYPGNTIPVLGLAYIDEYTGFKDIREVRIFSGDMILDLETYEVGEVLKEKDGSFTVYFGYAKKKPIISDIKCITIGGKRKLDLEYEYYLKHEEDENA